MAVTANRYLVGAGVHAAILLSLAGVNRLMHISNVAYHPSFVFLTLTQLLFIWTCAAGAALSFLACVWKLFRKSWKPSLLFLAGAFIQILAVVIAQGFLAPIGE
jgi:hypothetical protein